MSSFEEVTLSSTDFEMKIVESFKSLRKENDFFDVTIACDDDQIEAHRVVLAACSPVLKNIFQRHKQTHPVVYLKGTRMENLRSVINFMYNGEANISKLNLNQFLEIAEDLKVRGLCKETDNTLFERQLENSVDYEKVDDFDFLTDADYKVDSFTDVACKVEIDVLKKTKKMKRKKVDVKSEDISALDIEIEKLMHQSGHSKDRLWHCDVCYKSDPNKRKIKEHVETHIRGFTHSCDNCDTVSKSRAALKKHKQRVHSSIKDTSTSLSEDANKSTKIVAGNILELD